MMKKIVVGVSLMMFVGAQAMDSGVNNTHAKKVHERMPLSEHTDATSKENIYGDLDESDLLIQVDSDEESIDIPGLSSTPSWFEKNKQHILLAGGYTIKYSMFLGWISYALMRWHNALTDSESTTWYYASFFGGILPFVLFEMVNHRLCTDRIQQESWDNYSHNRKLYYRIVLLAGLLGATIGISSGLSLA